MYSLGLTAGAAINPARDFSPRLLSQLAGWSGPFTAAGGWWCAVRPAIPCCLSCAGGCPGCCLTWAGCWAPCSTSSWSASTTTSLDILPAPPTSNKHESENDEIVRAVVAPGVDTGLIRPELKQAATTLAMLGGGSIY